MGKPDERRELMADRNHRLMESAENATNPFKEEKCMATFSTHMMNLMEAYRREGYTNPEEFLGDLMLQNDLLRTAAVAPANKGFYNETLRALALGKGGVTMINGGIPDISAGYGKSCRLHQFLERDSHLRRCEDR